MKKFIKLFTIMLAVTITVVGCSDDKGSNGDNSGGNNSGGDVLDAMLGMEQASDEFEDLMDDKGYSMKIEYKGERAGNYYIFYSLGNDQYVDYLNYKNNSGDNEDFMMCNVNGEYSGVYNGTTYDDLGYTEEEIEDFCDESIEFYDDEYEFILDDMFEVEMNIKYASKDDYFKAYGDYEESEEGTQGSYELIIKKDLSVLTFEDDFYLLTITIGDDNYK